MNRFGFYLVWDAGWGLVRQSMETQPRRIPCLTDQDLESLLREQAFIILRSKLKIGFKPNEVNLIFQNKLFTDYIKKP
ncbi:hypothetical protein O9993_01915 [Vibrio lentus]|nr:hypothetical protein [Vibrio lentus]